MNTPDSVQTSSLRPETEACVRQLAMTDGNSISLVEEAAIRGREAAQGGSRTVTQRALESAQRRWSAAEAHHHEARSRLQYAEPKIILKGHRSKVGFVGCLVMLVLLAGLVVILWNENGAAAQALLSTGAFDVDTIERARMVMLTPVAVGIAFVLGFKVLPPFVRRAAFLAA